MRLDFSSILIVHPALFDLATPLIATGPTGRCTQLYAIRAGQRIHCCHKCEENELVIVSLWRHWIVRACGRFAWLYRCRRRQLVSEDLSVVLEGWNGLSWRRNAWRSWSTHRPCGRSGRRFQLALGNLLTERSICSFKVWWVAWVRGWQPGHIAENKRSAAYKFTICYTSWNQTTRWTKKYLMFLRHWFWFRHITRNELA